MSRTPSGSDVTGGDGLDSYRTNPDARTPALGRSSRDLATDSGPAEASNEAIDAGNTESELLSGHVNETPGDADRKRGRHPEIDPDARLGLHPTIPSKDK
jgi:hypothetical protein